MGGQLIYKIVLREEVHKYENRLFEIMKGAGAMGLIYSTLNFLLDDFFLIR